MDGELIRLYWAAVRVDCPRMPPGCLSSSLPELRHRKRSATRRDSAGAQTQHQGVLDLRPRPA